MQLDNVRHMVPTIQATLLDPVCLYFVVGDLVHPRLPCIPTAAPPYRPVPDLG